MNRNQINTIDLSIGLHTHMQNNKLRGLFRRPTRLGPRVVDLV